MSKKYINRKKLRAIAERDNIQLKDIAHALGLSYHTFWRRLNKGFDFTENEIRILVKKFGDEITK